MQFQILIGLAILGCAAALPGNKNKADVNGYNANGEGWAEKIREDPENPKPYIEYGEKNYEKIQGKVDVLFGKKSKEGAAIGEGGKETQRTADKADQTFEKGHYDQMFGAFKWAEKDMDKAVDTSLQDKPSPSGKKGKGKKSKKAEEEEPQEEPKADEEEGTEE